MSKLLAVLIALLLISPAGAADKRSPAEDAYVACVIGKAVVEMHYGETSNEALDVAFPACKKLAVADPNDGVGDFITMTVQNIEAAVRPS